MWLNCLINFYSKRGNNFFFKVEKYFTGGVEVIF